MFEETELRVLGKSIKTSASRFSIVFHLFVRLHQNTTSVNLFIRLASSGDWVRKKKCKCNIEITSARHINATGKK